MRPLHVVGFIAVDHESNACDTWVALSPIVLSCVVPSQHSLTLQGPDVLAQPGRRTAVSPVLLPEITCSAKALP